MEAQQVMVVLRVLVVLVVVLEVAVSGRMEAQQVMVVLRVLVVLVVVLEVRSATVTWIELFDNNTRSFILEPYNHLLDPIQHQYYETDVVGICIGDIVPIMFAAGKKIRRTVVVEDDTWATMWDEYAYKREAMRHAVFILQLAKVKYWDGTPAIHNALFRTKIYVNHEIPKIAAFRTRVQEHEAYVKEMVGGIRDSEPVGYSSYCFTFILS
ncbi:replication protein A 70 kDa DNA-binding subunit B, partial [Tanacetum coccineum]